MENIENLWNIIEEWYKLLHSDKTTEAEEKFLLVYNTYIELKVDNKDDNFNKFISSILGLGEINMKKWNFEKSLEFYIKWNDLTDSKDFNILFNLWVVYRNLWEDEKSNEFLDKAKKINLNDPNLIRFIWEQVDVKNDENVLDDNNNGNNFDQSFEDKVKKMIDEINK